ncbi:MAG: hypothetical protein SF187_23800 [Deltaproteobacteria bacterium]|nr:hypothetical protein [Deltaproteobacteria bacterium]
MSYDITLLKPPGAVLDDNRRWAQHLCQSFADLDDAQIDVRASADVAGDVGMSEGDWVSRGIGVMVCRVGQPDFVDISFWETTADISLPNFPERDAAELLDSIAPYVDSLRALGFVLIDPLSDEPCDGPRQVERLLAGYSHRQRAVGVVAELVGGEAPGRSK